MRFSLVILLATLLYGSPNLMAKNMAMEISYAEFMNAENQAYLELYFALHSHSVDYKALPDGGFRGGVEITVSLYRDSTLKAADRFRLLSPELEDTLNLGQVFIHQLRFPVNSGTYLVRFDLVDVNDPSETYQVSQTITTHLGGNELMTSELLLLDSYKKAEEKNAFTRSGYNLIPQITSGTPYFNDSVNQISFYSEIYNTQQSLGDGEPYLVKYYLKDADRNQVLQAYGSFSRKKASQVEPVLRCIFH
ncbi:MAG: hypothetical protein U5L96_11015 [Owenweeksia sp.]|nr:hypothetical protein [Owenweeksia sp.]